LQIYTAAALFNGISNGMFVAVVFTYNAQYMGFASKIWLMLIVYIGANFAALPLWAAVVKRIGKHRAWAWGLGLAALCYPPMALLPPGEGSFLPILALYALAGASYSISNVATPAVLGDVADFETWRSGSAKSGILFALQALITKFNIAVGTGLAFLIIGLFGFTNSGPQTPKAIFGIQLAHLYLPSALNMVGILFIWRFPLDGRRQAIVRRRLDQRASRQGA
jgi:Na+/melibiose symporter-like transporter